MKFTQYDNEGRILFGGDVPETMIAAQGVNIVLGHESPDTHYVVNRAFAKRQTSPARIGMDKTLQHIPPGAMIWINDKCYPATEPVCSLEFTYPGTYRIRIECFPYLDFITEVTQ